MCKFTIISPVYNMEKYLEQCIESLLSQDLTDFEVLFVNDGSTDSTAEILNSYAESDKRIRVFHKQNEGQGVARNFALPYAKGDYVLYLDPDDWLEQGALTKLYNKFQEDNYDVIFFNVCRYYQETGIKNLFRYIDCFYTKFKNDTFNRNNATEILFETNGLAFKAYNREFLVKNNIKYSPTKYIEDSEFFIGAVLNAEKMVCLNESIVNYRIHKTSSCSTTHLNIDVIEKTFYVCEAIVKKFFIQENNKKLMDSFLKNRIEQLLFHYIRVDKKYKKSYYQMMKRVLVYINQTYSLDFIILTSLKTQIDLILKHNWLGYSLARKRFFFRIHLASYFEI